MVKRLIYKLLEILPARVVYAHCDIPCGVYDPHAAQLAAHTIIRMTQLLAELKRKDKTKVEHDIARMTHVKEDHGEMVEEELGTLENDYFKEEHFNTCPELKKLFAEAVKLSIKVRQIIDMQSAEQLLETVLKISEIFYKTKNLQPVRLKSPYPTGREIVVYK